MQSLGEVTPVLAIVSRAERATLRAAREMARRQPQTGRLAHLDGDDGLAMGRPELERLTAAHRNGLYRKLEWRHLAARQPAPLPVRTHELEKAARRALATYEPSWQERMFGDEGQRRRQLTAKVLEAARADEIAFQQAYRTAETHNAEALLARKLLELDPKAIKEALVLKSRLTDMREGLNGVSVATPGAGRVVLVAEIIQEGDVPYERLTGDEPRAQRREPIPTPERRQIHLAAVCAGALRVAAEAVGILPVEAVEVIAVCETQSADGARRAPEPVLQLLMTVKALGELDWKKGDAVSLATSIGARMDWDIETGFAPIRPIALTSMGRPLAESA